MKNPEDQKVREESKAPGPTKIQENQKAPEGREIPGDSPDAKKRKNRLPWGSGAFSAEKLKSNLPGLLLCTVLWRFTALVAMIYLFEILLRFALHFTKYSYVTLQNLPRLLLTPAAIAGILLLALAFLLLVYFEKMMLINGVQAGAAGVRMNLAQFFSGGFSRGALYFRRYFLFTAGPFTAFELLLSLPFVLELSFRINPFSTYLPILLRRKPAVIGIAAVIVLLAVYSFLRSYSVWFRIEKGIPRRESHRMGRRMAERHAVVRILDFCAAELSSILCWIALRFLVTLMVSLFCRIFVASDLRTAVILTLKQYISIITLLLAPALASVLHTKLLCAEFYTFSSESPKQQLHLPGALSQRQTGVISLVMASVLAAAILFPVRDIYSGAIQAERTAAPAQIAAHRGFSSAAPENSLPAMNLAVDFMADYAEIDVQCTADGQVVLFHDASVRRFTGRNTKVSDMTLAEMKEIDLGKGYDDEYAGTQVPTLAEALECAKGRIHLLIELKRNDASDDLAQQVVSLVEEYGMENNCIFQSTDYRYLYQLKQINPDLTCGIIISSAFGNVYTSNPNIDFFCVRSAFVTGSAVRSVQKSGKQIYAWTVDTRDEMERMKRLSVNVIITDYPVLAREVLYRIDRDEFIQSVLDQMQAAADSGEDETAESVEEGTVPATVMPTVGTAPENPEPDALEPETALAPENREPETALAPEAPEPETALAPEAPSSNGPGEQPDADAVSDFRNRADPCSSQRRNLGWKQRRENGQLFTPSDKTG